MVRDAGGAIVTTATKARDAGHLRLIFADGEVPVAAIDGDAPPPPKPARKPSPPHGASPGRGQGELF